MSTCLMQSRIAGIKRSGVFSLLTTYTSFAPVCRTSLKVPNSSPSSETTFNPIRSAIKYSFSPKGTAFSLVTYRLFCRYCSTSLILSMPLNFSITRFLKNRAPATSSSICSFPVSKITCFNFLKRIGSSVVGNTFTSPRTPCVVVITPICNKSSIVLLFILPQYAILYFRSVRSCCLSY